MKVAMTLTMDGLVRALRGTAHMLAEAAEDRYAGVDGLQATPKPDARLRSELDAGESYDRRRD